MKQKANPEVTALAEFLREQYGAIMTAEDVKKETGYAISTLAKWRCHKMNLSYVILGRGKGATPGYLPTKVAEFILRNQVNVNAA